MKSVDHGMADLDHTAETRESLFVDLLVSQQFRIVEKVAKKPAQLPHRLLCAVEAAGDRPMGENCGFENREAENIKGLLRVPTELGAIDTDKENPIWNLLSRIADCLGKTRNLAFHATTSGVEAA